MKTPDTIITDLLDDIEDFVFECVKNAPGFYEPVIKIEVHPRFMQKIQADENFNVFCDRCDNYEYKIMGYVIHINKQIENFRITEIKWILTLKNQAGN